MFVAETDADLKSIQWVAPRIESIYLYHISLSEFLVPDADLERLKRFLGKLTTSIVDKYRVTPECFVQTKYILTGKWPNLLSEYGSCWRFLMGLGMRRDRFKWERPAPGQGLMDLLLKPQDSPTTRTELVYYFGRDEHFDRFFPGMKWPSPMDIYLGCGGVIIYMAPDGGKFLERARELYLPVLAPADQHFDFYLPLFDMEDFERASEECLRVWFNLFDICIMETRQDPGIFIASRHDLDDLLMNLQGDIQWEEAYESNGRERLEDRAGG
jgi:hypothetical protein